MSEKPTTAKYTLSEIKAARARGEDPTRRDAPEAESLGEDFWKDARVVMPRGKTSVHLRLDSDTWNGLIPDPIEHDSGWLSK